MDSKNIAKRDKRDKPKKSKIVTIRSDFCSDPLRLGCKNRVESPFCQNIVTFYDMGNKRWIEKIKASCFECFRKMSRKNEYIKF